MNFLEKNLEDIIFETDNELLEHRGLDISGIKRRQVRIGNYGICDLVTVERIPRFDTLQITVYELKKDVINISTFLQGIKYCKGIKRYFNNRGSVIINLALVGYEVDRTNHFVFVPDVVSSEDFNLSLYTYNYSFDGLKFNRISGYKLSNEGF